MDGVFLPLLLDATGFRGGGYIALAFLVPTLLLGLWNLVKWLRRRSDSQQHPIMRQLARFGEPRTVASDLDQEIMVGPVTDLKAVKLTPSWMISALTYRTDLVPLTDLAWVYKKVTQHRVNFVPAGKSYAAMIYDRAGKNYVVAGKEPLVDTVLTTVAARAPWMMIGYDKDFERSWNKERPAVIAALDQRRAAMLNPQRGSELGNE